MTYTYASSPRLRAASLLFLLSVPLAVWEAGIASRLPWSRLDVKNLMIVGGVTLLFALLTVWRINRGERLAFYFWGVVLGSWGLLSIWFSYRARVPAIAFFAVGSIVMVLGAISWWVFSEMNRSYFNPQLKWYQGHPKAIPHVRCWVSSLAEDGKNLADHAGFSVGRIDQHGIFVFRTDTSDPSAERLKNLNPKATYELVLRFEKRELHCFGKVRRLLIPSGLGLEFFQISSDLRKELGDFIEVLRGEGYVA